MSDLDSLLSVWTFFHLKALRNIARPEHRNSCEARGKVSDREEHTALVRSTDFILVQNIRLRV